MRYPTGQHGLVVSVSGRNGRVISFRRRPGEADLLTIQRLLFKAGAAGGTEGAQTGPNCAQFGSGEIV